MDLMTTSAVIICGIGRFPIHKKAQNVYLNKLKNVSFRFDFTIITAAFVTTIVKASANEREFFYCLDRADF